MRLKKDVVFVAGSKATVDKGRKIELVTEHVSVLAGPTPDTIMELLIPLEDAVELGLVEDERS